MNFSKKFLRIVACIMMVFILIPAMPSYAATFKDVSSNHWAYSYIERMVGLKYISGYEDNTFKPDGSLTYLETLQLVSKLINVTEAEKTTMKQRYQTMVTLNGVPTWAQEAVMKCLLKSVITEEELNFARSKDMIKTGTNKRVGRLDTSIYLAKAMGLDKVVVNAEIGQLYKDLLPNHEQYKPLLYLLINAGVLNKEGMGNYEFKPSDPVQRGQMAKMLATAYDYLLENNSVPDLVSKESIKGQLVKITPYGNNTYFITLKDKANKETAYYVDTETNIKLDNKSTTMDKLLVGQEIILTKVKDASTVISIEATSIEEELTGYIKSIIPSINKITIEYEEGKVTKTADLTVDKNADITINGIEADIYDLKVKDKVNIFSKNSIVSEIEAIAKDGEFEGIITYIERDNRTSNIVYYITIEDSKGKETEFMVDNDASIYRNGKRARIEDLRVSDEIYVELEYDVIVEIDADVVELEIEGYIVGINNKLNQGYEITIRNKENNKEETYFLARDAYIRIDKAAAYAFNLNVGYFVEIVVGSNEIIEIYADSVASESLVRGKIKALNTKNGEIDLDVTSSDIDGIGYGDVLYIKTSADIEVSIGRSVYNDILDLEKGMNVYVFGYYDGYRFIAREINVR